MSLGYLRALSGDYGDFATGTSAPAPAPTMTAAEAYRLAVAPAPTQDVTATRSGVMMTEAKVSAPIQTYTPQQAVDLLGQFVTVVTTSRTAIPADAMAQFKAAWDTLVRYTGCGCGTWPPDTGATRDQSVAKVVDLVNRAVAQSAPKPAPVVETTATTRTPAPYAPPQTSEAYQSAYAAANQPSSSGGGSWSPVSTSTGQASMPGVAPGAPADTTLIPGARRSGIPWWVWVGGVVIAGSVLFGGRE